LGDECSRTGLWRAEQKILGMMITGVSKGLLIKEIIVKRKKRGKEAGGSNDIDTGGEVKVHPSAPRTRQWRCTVQGTFSHTHRGYYKCRGIDINDGNENLEIAISIPNAEKKDVTVLGSNGVPSYQDKH